MPTYFDIEVFAHVLRYLILAAQNKRVVPYSELENVFGLSHNMAGFYAGKVGHYCQQHDWPMLNAMVVNMTNCMPSEGFDGFLPEGQDWGSCLASCWSFFHLKTDRAHQVQNFTGLTNSVRAWGEQEAA